MKSWIHLGATMARRLGLGRMCLLLWHQPIGRARDSLRNGGPWAERETERHRRAMEAAASCIPPLPNVTGSAALHLLTGRRFWYQTVFCLHSWFRNGGAQARIELYDDGTLDPATSTRLARLGPSVRIHSIDETRERLERHLPRAKFPVLRERWDAYPNIRKLTDPHLAQSGWKLVLDSDLLFFRRPTLLNAWLEQPARLLHAEDCTESYGYSRSLLNELADAQIPQKINVGLCGLRSDALDWEALEHWCTVLQERERTSYYLEQALVAILAARAGECIRAPAADYVTKPHPAEVRAPRAIMHHYVAESKRWYFRYGWRHTID